MDNAMKAQIVALVKYVENSDFWRAQISQIIVTDDRMFEVVPVLGKQKILIGDTSRLDEKFDNLYAFYKKVLNRIGWEKYEVLDVRYAGQVVAAPALPWKPPIDNAMSNMNWVKSIIGKDSGTYRIDSPSMQVMKVQSKNVVIATPKNIIDAAKESKASAVTKKGNVKAKPQEKKQVTETKKPVVSKAPPKIKDKKIEHKKTEIKEKSSAKKTDKKDKEKGTPAPKYLYH
jgi:cell division protein FtsQ